MPNDNHIIALPSKLKAILDNNEELETILFNCLIPFSHILKENKLYFFPEYTDHGIKHIECVLEGIENLISDDTISTLSANDVGIILVSTVLHDIGMHTSPEMFKNMIDGQYNGIEGNLFKEKTWNILWQEYLKDCKYWGADKKKNVFGNEDYVITAPNLNDLQSLNEYDKMLIGEFIRINHPRIAYEIAINGFIGNTAYSFNDEKLPHHFMQIAGLVARSHGMNVRDTFDYLKKLFGRLLWKKPHDIRVVFLMTLIRLADYLQIDSTRINVALLKLKNIYSPFSEKEHETHKSIDFIQLDNDDKERIIVQASPQNAEIYVKIEKLIQDIQKEFDISWAVLGEVYNNEYKLKYRRIVTNITDEEVRDGYSFVPKQFGFKFNAEISKLLIAPLYGNNPSYGVRELVQNAVDACRTRMAIDDDYKNRKESIAHVKVSLNSSSKILIVSDSGIGMTIEEIERYFLTIGSSYENSTDWQRIKDINKSYRTGRFGIGILAAFLIGDKIKVKTKSPNGQHGYQFTLSLNSKFVQIDKKEAIENGTTIEIECYDESFEQLSDGALLREGWDLSKVRYVSLDNEWFDWYVDLNPIVEYYYDNQPIHYKHLNYNEYKRLNHSLDCIEDVYWQPMAISEISQGHGNSLYINGFKITDYSNKTQFYLRGSQKYNKLIIPSLYINDINNDLPINLNRDNIDESISYPFEKELATAIFKDYLCQLLAINLPTLHLSRLLFFNSRGFALNVFPFYPFSDDYRRLGTALASKKLATQYTNNFLLGKYIAIIGGNNTFNQIIKKKALFDLLPDVFFSFYADSTSINLIHYFGSIADSMQRFFPEYSLVVNDETYSKDVLPIMRKHIKFTQWANDNYQYSTNDFTNQIIKDIITYFSSNTGILPPYIIVFKVNDEVIESELDEFFNEYGGDMIIPYDEADRRTKFAKIYDECSEDIEEYRKKYASK